MRISDWSSDVCSSDLDEAAFGPAASAGQSGFGDVLQLAEAGGLDRDALAWRQRCHLLLFPVLCGNPHLAFQQGHGADAAFHARSEEHTSELQSLMRISYAVFCLKKKKTKYNTTQLTNSIQTSQYKQSSHHKTY